MRHLVFLYNYYVVLQVLRNTVHMALLHIYWHETIWTVQRQIPYSFKLFQGVPFSSVIVCIKIKFLRRCSWVIYCTRSTEYLTATIVPQVHSRALSSLCIIGLPGTQAILLSLMYCNWYCQVHSATGTWYLVPGRGNSAHDIDHTAILDSDVA